MQADSGRHEQEVEGSSVSGEEEEEEELWRVDLRLLTASTGSFPGGQTC